MTATLKSVGLRDRCCNGALLKLKLLVLLLLLLLALARASDRRSWLSGESVHAFAAHLSHQQLPSGLIVSWHASSIRVDAAARAALIDLLMERRVSHTTLARFALPTNVRRFVGRLGVLINVDVVGGRLCEAGRLRFDDGRLAWLVVAASKDDLMGGDVTHWVKFAFAGCNVSVDADITLAVRVGANASTPWYRLFDVHSVCQACGQPLLVQPKGRWSLECGWRLSGNFQRRSAVRRRNDFAGLKMYAATAILEKPPNVDNLTFLTNELDNKQLDTMQRKTYQLIKLLEPMWHMRFEVLFKDVWGAPRNGSWTGVVGAIIARQAEFSMCPLRYTRERLNAIHFAPDLHVEIIPFIFRHPRRNAIRNIFFEPLTTAVWWCVAALILAAVLLLTAQTRFSAIHGERRAWHFVVLIVAEAFFGQGPAPDTYGRTSMRLLVLWLCLFSFLLLQFYGGFIVGSLLAVLPRSITTLQALYNSSLQLGMESVAYNYEIFEHSSSGSFVHALYTQRICQPPRSEHITSIERGAQLIKRGGFAFHVSANRMLYLLKSQLSDDEFCDLQQINLAPPYQSSIALRKQSPYREHFAAAILQLRTAGLMQRNDARWRTPQTDCRLQQQNREVDVDLEHFVPALIFLAIAHLVAVAALLLELALHHCMRGWWRRRRALRV